MVHPNSRVGGWFQVVHPDRRVEGWFKVVHPDWRVEGWFMVVHPNSRVGGWFQVVHPDGDRLVHVEGDWLTVADASPPQTCGERAGCNGYRRRWRRGSRQAAVRVAAIGGPRCGAACRSLRLVDCWLHRAGGSEGGGIGGGRGGGGQL